MVRCKRRCRRVMAGPDRRPVSMGTAPPFAVRVRSTPHTRFMAPVRQAMANNVSAASETRRVPWQPGAAKFSLTLASAAAIIPAAPRIVQRVHACVTTRPRSLRRLITATAGSRPSLPNNIPPKATARPRRRTIAVDGSVLRTSSVIDSFFRRRGRIGGPSRTCPSGANLPP